MINNIKTLEMFDLSHTKAKTMLEKFEYPWQALSSIGACVKELIATIDKDKYYEHAENVWIAKSAKVFPNNYIMGPCIIGENTEVRPGAFIRGNVLVGDNCVVGNSTELKNVILFDNVQVPHYNYVGDSILGFKSHTGAGAITSNVKQDNTQVVLNVKDGDETVVFETGLRKFGAILGDHVEVGCNAVMNPGTVVCKNSRVYPLTMVRAIVPPNSINKNTGEIVEIKKG